MACTKREMRKKMNKLIDRWFDNPIIDKSTGGKIGPFQRFYEKVTGLDLDIGKLPNEKEFNRLESSMKSFLKGTYKKEGKLAEWFKLPENILKKNPVTARYYDDLVRVSNYYRGNQQHIKSNLQVIVRALNKASGENTMMSKFGFGRSQAQKTLRKMEAQYNKYKAEGRDSKAESYWQENLADISKHQDLQAMNNLHELLLKPWLVDRQNYDKSKLKYGGDLIEAASLWHKGIVKTKRNGDRVVEVKPLKEELWKILGDGLKKSINVFKSFQNNHNGMEFKVKELDRLYNEYFSPKAKDRIKDYFPTQVLDIAPTISKFSQDIHSGFLDKADVVGRKSVETYIKRMVDDVTSALKVSGHTYEKSLDRPKRISQDVVGILDSYANNVMRFNYNAAATEAVTNALRGLKGLSGGKFDEHVGFLTDYVYDMHQAAVGSKFTNSKLANISRSLTSFQFLSKLGLNIRSAARNATQSLQNWVYFGGRAIREAVGDLQSDYMKTITNRELSRHGFEFVNIAEISNPAKLLDNVRIDRSGKVIHDVAGMGAKFNDYLENTARITGKPMQWVENHVNRGLTFKLAFVNRFNHLKSNDTFVRKILQSKGQKATDEAVRDEAIRRASNYAADMVKELHYQYDPFAKIKATRGPVGSVLGQFSTYGINFFEYQRKILAKGGNDVLAKSWNTPEAWRMYRLGMLYTMVSGLSAVTNTSYGTLIQNDTADRLNRLDMWLGGTKEEKEKAFFGLDPITSTFGGPTVSDVIRLGTIFNLNNLDSDDLNTYLSVHVDFYEDTEDDKVEELVRFGNQQIYRLIYQTIPRSINGTSMPTLLGQELALYNTPELDWLKQSFLKPLQKIPGKTGEYFTPKGKAKKKNKEYFETKKYSPSEVDNMLDVFR